MKILCPNSKKFNLEALSLFSKKHKLTCLNINQKKFNNIFNNYDCVIIRFNHEVRFKNLSKLSNLKYIITCTTGLDHIDVDKLSKKNIKIYSLQDKKFMRSIHASAEHTFALLLSITKNIPWAFDKVKKYNWNNNEFINFELFNKTIGIIGYGRNGKKISKYAKAFGMRVIFYDVNKKYSNIVGYKSINYIYAQSDILIYTLPLNNNTRNLVDKKSFDKMKKSPIIINTSRFDIFNLNSLISALNQKKISKVAIDVLNEEFISDLKKNKLINYSKNNKNLLITPHIAGLTYDSIKKTDNFLIKKFLTKVDI